MKPSTYGRVAAATFAAEAVFPIVFEAVGGSYYGFSFIHDLVINIGLAVVWCASALVGLVQRPPRSFFVMIAGGAVTFVHFVMFSVATGDHGPYAVSLPWLVLFPIQMYCVVHSAPAFFRRSAGEKHEVSPEPEREAAPRPGPWRPSPA